MNSPIKRRLYNVFPIVEELSKRKQPQSHPFFPPICIFFFLYISHLHYQHLRFIPPKQRHSVFSASPHTTRLFFTPALLFTKSSTSAILQHNDTAAKAFALAVRWTPSLHTTSFAHSSSRPGSLSQPSKSNQ